MQQLLRMLKMPPIDFYLPNSSNFDLVDNYQGELNNGRDFVIQGEVLQFYLIVRLSSLFNKTNPTEGENRTQTTASVEEASTGSKSTENDATSLESQLESTAFRNRLRLMFSNLKIRLEFMKSSSVSSEAAATSSSMTNENASPLVNQSVGTDKIDHIFTKYSTPSSKPKSNSKCFTLANGDIVYPLETNVSVMSSYINHEVSLTALIYPPEYKLSIQQLISPLYTERSAVRTVALPVRVVEPFSVASSMRHMDAATLISVLITNQHTEEIFFSKSTVNFFDIRDTKNVEVATSFEYHHYFKVHLDESDFPITLKPKEQYNLVITLENPAISLINKYISHPTPSMHLTWSTPTLNGSIESPIKIYFPEPNNKKLVVTFQVNANPITLHSVFSVFVTIYNLSDRSRHFILEVPLVQASDDNMIGLNQIYFKDLKHAIANRNQNQNATDFVASAVMPNEENVMESEENVFQRSFELVQDFNENKRQMASLVCVENVIRIGKIEPKGQKTTRIDCLAMREGLYAIQNLKLYDIEKKTAYLVDKACQILVVRDVDK